MRININIILICGMLTCPQVNKSQNITADRNILRAADYLVKQQVEYKDPGISGKDLIWDFSMLQSINDDYQLRYFIPDSAQMDHLCGKEHRTRYYYTQRNDSLWTTGFENATTRMNYTSPELKLRFPFSYGDTLYTVFEGKGLYSHRLPLRVKGYTRVMADAEGDILLPQSERVRKALRVRTLRHYTEMGKDSVEMTLDTYSWYARGIRYPVFESVRTTISRKGDRKDELGESLNDTTVFSTSFYYPPALQLSQVETDTVTDENENEAVGVTAVFTEARLLPNPVTDNLNIDYKLTRRAQLWFSVHNSAGTSLISTSPFYHPEGRDNTSINMSKLNPGTYMLYVHVDDMVLRQVVVKK